MAFLAGLVCGLVIGAIIGAVGVFYIITEVMIEYAGERARGERRL